MTTIDTIRAEIERLKTEELNRNSIGVITGSAFFVKADDLLAFLDTLPEQPVEETPEPYTGIYDEAYLQDKIARATKSWEGVDTDKMLAEFRGYEQPVTDCHELKKHILEWTELMVGASFPEQDGDYISEQDYRNVIKQTARHFAEWQKDKMMKEAVECMVMDFSSNLPRPQVDILLDPGKYHTGDKVRVIVIKED